jgi:hypothetical protein
VTDGAGVAQSLRHELNRQLAGLAGLSVVAEPVVRSTVPSSESERNDGSNQDRPSDRSSIVPGATALSKKRLAGGPLG